MSYTTDDRWSPGNSRATIPDDAPAAYAARWIDHDTWADIVPDRQGFAYNVTDDVDRLSGLLAVADPAKSGLQFVPRDETICLVDLDALKVYVRRAGGYFYVDAWVPAVDELPR